jgi:hypothetical protein
MRALAPEAPFTNLREERLKTVSLRVGIRCSSK